MTIFILCLIIGVVFLIGSIIWYVKSDGESIGAVSIIVFSIFIVSIMGIIAIIQPLTLKNEALRQEKERQQIIYQIEHLDNEKDKIKLNEWILTYNDWVNDVNTEKQVFGWCAWHRDFDMSKHTIIDLV